MSYKTDIGKVKGLGSAKHGFKHWWMQRMTAVLLIPCGLYVLFGLVGSNNAEAVLVWLQNPMNSGVLLLFIFAGSYHGALGVQVVIEDYIHNHSVNLVFQYLTKILMIVMMMVSIYAIATILIG